MPMNPWGTPSGFGREVIGPGGVNPALRPGMGVVRNPWARMGNPQPPYFTGAVNPYTTGVPPMPPGLPRTQQGVQQGIPAGVIPPFPDGGTPQQQAEWKAKYGGGGAGNPISPQLLGGPGATQSLGSVPTMTNNPWLRPLMQGMGGRISSFGNARGGFSPVPTQSYQPQQPYGQVGGGLGAPRRMTNIPY